MSHLSTNPTNSTLSTTTDACPDVATELETALSTASVAATFLPSSLLSPTPPARRARKSGAKKTARKRATRLKTDKKTDTTDKTDTSEKVVNVTSLDTDKADRADDAEVTGSTDDASERAAQTRVQDTQATQATQATDKNDKTKMNARRPLGDSLEYLMVDQTLKDITKRLASMPERRGACANAEYLQPSVKRAPTKLGAFKGFKSSSNPAARLSDMLHARGWQFVNAKNHCTYKRSVIFEDGTRMDQHFSHSKTTSDNYHGPMKALCDLKCLEDDVCAVIL